MCGAETLSSAMVKESDGMFVKVVDKSSKSELYYMKRLMALALAVSGVQLRNICKCVTLLRSHTHSVNTQCINTG